MVKMDSYSKTRPKMGPREGPKKSRSNSKTGLSHRLYRKFPFLFLHIYNWTKLKQFAHRTDELDAEEDKHEIEYTKNEITEMKKLDTKYASEELP